MASQATAGSSCLSCRARKVRCDRQLPQCTQCKRKALRCQVSEPPPRMLWLPIKTPDDFISEPEDADVEMHVRRQPLFHGVQQARNAADLLSSISGFSVGMILERFDQEADGIRDGTTASDGPFHAFRSERPMTEPILSHTPSPNLPDLELWQLLSSDLGGLIDDDILTVHWSPNLCISEEPVVTKDVEEDLSTPSSPSRGEPTLVAQGVGTLVAVGPSGAIPPDLEDFTMSTAKLLLDHYQIMTTTFYTPAPIETKTPWEILYVPNLLSTLGEIALTGNSSDARVSLLFAVFAISAFRMDVLQSPYQEPASQDWNMLGKICRERATKRLQRALRRLSAGLPKEDKYKNILMPLLSMVTICVISGEMKNAAHYLSDIEQIITRYGIPKTQSRKTKMLHSIYLYLRILTKGTHTYNRSLRADSSESLQCEVDPWSGPNSTTWSILMVESCVSPDGLNLDFMQPLAPPKSTFEQIYSLPASLFKLILETTQLASKVEDLRQLRHPNRDHDTFAQTVKQLENDICEWKYHHYESASPADMITCISPLKERFPYHLTQAIYSALIIYFYRSVRDVNATILQPYVQQTIYHLTEYDKYKEKHKDRYGDIAWPAFIAGCEATTSDSRQQISEWLKRSARSNGMLMFTVALQVIEKVWAARKLPGNRNLSWSNIMSESPDLRVLVLS